jgi:hypothetical protein
MALLSIWAGRFLWILPLVGALVGAALGTADSFAEGHIRLPEAWTCSASTASGC